MFMSCCSKFSDCFVPSVLYIYIFVLNLYTWIFVAQTNWDTPYLLYSVLTFPINIENFRVQCNVIVTRMWEMYKNNTDRPLSHTDTRTHTQRERHTGWSSIYCCSHLVQPWNRYTAHRQRIILVIWCHSFSGSSA